MLRGQRLLQRLLAIAGFVGKEDNANPQRPPRVKRNSGGGEKKVTWDGGHDADPIAALAVGRDRAAMRQTSQRGKRLGQNFVGGLVAQRGHETHTAGVVIKAGIQQSWRTGAVQRL